METKISRIAQRAKENPKEIFTSIYHLINEELLIECHKELEKNKATGQDGISKDEYEENLEGNIRQLAKELRNKSYKPTPAKRVYIPKANGKVRGIAIANYEDKIVQLAIKKIIEAIYEPKFLNCMYGFRPKRGCHDATKELAHILYSGTYKYVVEADIKGFFDNINHKWLMRCLEQHIKDTNMLRLINRYLKAGIIEKEVYIKSEEGTPQGGILSPVLANIYMHYVLSLWFKIRIQDRFLGESRIIIYADDFVCCFQRKGNAEQFMKELLPKRLEKFGLELAEEKTKLIKFDRNNPRNSKTFDFLGFTYYIGKSTKGFYIPKVKTSKKKYRDKLKEYNNWLKQNRNLKAKEIIRKTNEKLRGHYHYFGVSFNMRMLKRYVYEIEKSLVKWLNRRSQKNSYTFDQFKEMMKIYPLEKPKIYVTLF